MIGCPDMSVNAYMCMCMCICAYVYVYVYVYACACVCVCVYVYVCVLIYEAVCAYTSHSVISCHVVPDQAK